MFRRIVEKGVLAALVVVLAGLFVSDAAAVVYFVSPGGTGSGSSWEDTGPLQATVNTASAGDEVWVAAGTYTSTQNPVLIMKEGVDIYGGFAGGEISGEQRDWNAHPALIDGEDVRGCVRGSNDARLDGFTITHGKWTAIGGGMSNDSASPTVANCTFFGNWGGYGGAIYNNNASPVITNCVFSNNSSDWDGGGMYNEMSSPVISGCLFSGNVSLRRGGGMCNSAALPEVSDCIFIENMSAVSGGGMYNEESSPMVSNCHFEANTAERGAGMYSCEESMTTVSHCSFNQNIAANSGGALCNISSSLTLVACEILDNTVNMETGNGGGITNSGASLTMVNCLLAGNSAQKNGGGLYNEISTPLIITNCTLTGNMAATGSGGGMYNLQSEPEITNTILWNNSASGGQMSNIEGTPVARVIFSCIGGGYEGTENIDSDPLFADVSARDFRLQATSPCIDTGTNTGAPDHDIQGVPRPQKDGYDMGAYEYVETGALQVILGPEAVITEDARWRRVGTETWYASGAVEDDIIVDVYTVEFSDVEGWLAPEPVSVSIVYDQTTVVDGMDTTYSKVLCSLSYSADNGGSITGQAYQVITCGENGEEVIASADEDYLFFHWSDGSRANPRTDVNVADDISVTAFFVPVFPADINKDAQVNISEAIAYIAGWQQGTGNTMPYAIRAAFLWQKGEYYTYDPAEPPPQCWTPWQP